MARRRAFVTTALAVLALGATSVACGSGPSDPNAQPFKDVDVAGHTTNPEGLAYPTDHLGAEARTASTPGDRIPNLSFQAYVDSNESAGLQTVSLADYYDPYGKRLKLLHVMAAAVWCTICRGQTQDMEKQWDTLHAQGLETVQLIVNGSARGTGPSLVELGQWVTSHGTSFTVGIDSLGRRLGELTSLDAVPWNALVDPRTMEIIYAGSGAPQEFADFAKAGLDWVSANPVDTSTLPPAFPSGAGP
jgi:hypothetical protein